MLFDSFQYWIFFFIVAALFSGLPFRFGKITAATCKLCLLHVVGHVFYP